MGPRPHAKLAAIQSDRAVVPVPSLGLLLALFLASQLPRTGGTIPAELPYITIGRIHHPSLSLKEQERMGVATAVEALA